MSPSSIALVAALAIAGQARPDQAEWKRVESPGGGFSVLVPGSAEGKLLRQKNEGGLSDTHMIVVEAGGVSFIASQTGISPPITPDKLGEFFDGIKRSYAEGPGRTLKREQRGGKLRGMPICFINVSAVGPDGRARTEQSRFLLGDPTHALTLQVVIPKGVQANNDDIRRFFNSLEYDASRIAKPPAPAPELARWRSFSPGGKGFAVQMPGAAKSQHKDLPDGPTGLDLYEVDLGDRDFTVAVYALAPAAAAARPPGEVLEDFAKQVVARSQGTLGAIRAAPKDGHEGRDIDFDAANPATGLPASGRIVAFADGARLVFLVYGGPKGSGHGAEVAKFVDSFRFTGRPTAADPKKESGRTSAQ